MYNTESSRVLENIGICQKLKNTYAFVPESSKNPCVKCGNCEQKCTAHLPIINRINEIYSRFEECGFTLERMHNQLKEIIGTCQKIAFYPAAGYTAYVLNILREAYPENGFHISLFDSNPLIWGTFLSGLEILNPDRILEVSPEVIIISNYNFGDEIYQKIKDYTKAGIKVVKLHAPNDVPWVF
jgi:Fe-S oxidoreductase